MHVTALHLLLVAAAFVAGCASAGARFESVPGVIERTIQVELAGDVTTAGVYRPRASVSPIVILFAHGFARDRSTFTQLSIELANAGFAVVVPDLPYFANQPANSRFLATLAEAIEQRGMPELDFGATRIIFAGFSAGGGASLLAAAAYPNALGWIGLDPVDRAGVAAAAAGGMLGPAFVIRAPASSCNAESNFTSAIKRLPNLASDRIELNTSHCDFEAPTDIVCTLVCGAALPERQRAIRDAVVAAAKAIAAQ